MQEAQPLKQIFVTTHENKMRIAILEQGKLAELFLESYESDQLVGNIYRGRIVNVVPNMQAAFVDIGIEKNAFLYIDEALPPEWQLERGKRQKPNIQELVRNGEERLVQVNKEAFGSKAPRVTTEISIPGRTLVYLPYCAHISISKRIQREAERKRLEQLAKELVTGPEGVIMRTSAEGAKREEIQRELQYLRLLWQESLEAAKDRKPPCLVYHDADLLTRVIRDVFSEEVDELVVDSSALFVRLQSMLKALFPELLKRLKAYTGKQSLFEAYGIETEIGKLVNRQVPLANGGSIVIDRTEAMTVIDVNSGRYTGKSMQQLEATVTQTNLEAAKEIARQLRLRDIGGIVVIDFIDMKASSNQAKVLETLQKELARDRTPTHVFGITQLGLVEMTRKKTRQSVPDLLTRACPMCNEKGRILHEREVISRLIREIRSLVREQMADTFIVELHPHVAEAEHDLAKLAGELEVVLHVRPDLSIHPDQYRICFAGSAEDAKRLLNEAQLS